MSYAICPISVVSLRSAPNKKGEQISQLLFGEMVEILDMKGKTWMKVRCQLDNYIGWVNSAQMKPITPSEFQLFQEHYAINLDLLQPILGDAHSLPISFGARLPNFDGMRFQLGEKTFTFSGQAVFQHDLKPGVNLILRLARRFLNAPHQFGGRSPLGIDSSGLAQLIYQVVGIRLDREAIVQVESGELIDFVEQAQPGDLAFFENKRGKIDHVGIVLPGQKVIHAHGFVRIDKLDHYGIFNEDQQRYSHRLRVMRRVLPPEDDTNAGLDTSEALDTQQYELF